MCIFRLALTLNMSLLCIMTQISAATLSFEFMFHSGVRYFYVFHLSHCDFYSYADAYLGRGNLYTEFIN